MTCLTGWCNISISLAFCFLHPPKKNTPDVCMHTPTHMQTRLLLATFVIPFMACELLFVSKTILHNHSHWHMNISGGMCLQTLKFRYYNLSCIKNFQKGELLKGRRKKQLAYDLKFTQQWRFKLLSSIWHHIVWEMIINISDKSPASLFRVEKISVSFTIVSALLWKQSHKISIIWLKVRIPILN